MDETAQPLLLARRRDFALGAATVRPSLRSVEGPLGSSKGEPKVIQVLLALADARGTVLSREDLLEQCWDGRIVGDDAINRAVAEVRRIAAAVGAGFEVETVPRVGYRITGIDWKVGPLAAATDGDLVASRRKAIAGGIAAVALVAGGGAAIIYRQRRAGIDDLIERGRVLQSSGNLKDEKRAEPLFRQAIASDPGRADAWGWLAVVLDDQKAAREAAQHAVSLDPREPNARAVLAAQRWDLDAWTQWEDALQGVLADAPDNATALTHLTLFYQGMGRCKDSWLTNEQAARVEPFNVTHQHRRALKHWIFGRVGAADKVADQALRLWPRTAVAWNARMLIYAFTDRAPAALALLDDVASRPANLTPPSVSSWRAALTAIASRAPAEIARAVEICTMAAGLAPGIAANAIMFFSHLGELDSAFAVANGLFEGRGSVVQQARGRGIRDAYSNSLWGRTQFLFIPATAPFRADPRFPELCRRMGHVAYWQKRGIWPDPFVRGALDPANQG
jgi:tetratricopeptide (TPR) repeat protein